MEMAYTELNAKLCAFLDKTPNSFFAVKNIKVELAAAGLCRAAGKQQMAAAGRRQILCQP